MHYANCVELEFEIDDCSNDVQDQSDVIRNFPSKDINIKETLSGILY